MRFTLILLSLLAAPGWVLSQLQLLQSGSEMVTPGETLSLTCTMTGDSVTNRYWEWVRQAPGKGLEWVGQIDWSGSDWRMYFGPSFKNRATLSADTSKNQFSLELRSLTVADTATYYCAGGYGALAMDYWGQGTLVTVTTVSPKAPSVFPLTTCPGEATTSQVTFGCLIADYFPEPVTVSWNPGATSTSVTTYPAMMSSSGLYSLSSQLTVPASSWESATYRCNVQHQPTSTSISKEIPKAKSHAPEVHVFHSSCHTDSEEASINLLCIISGFYPQTLTVTWLVNGQSGVLSGVTDRPKLDSDSKTFSTRSVATVSQESFMEDKRYTCHVYHPGSDTEIEDHARKCKSDAERCRSARGGDTQALPSTEETLSSSNIHVFMVPPSAAELYVNQYPKLTCLVVSLPSDTGLGVVWSREKPGSISPEPTILQEQSNGTFTAFSSLPIQTRDWENGETYTCKVEHSDLPSPIIKTITRKPGKRSAPGVYLLDPHPDELSSGKDSVSLTCIVRGFFPEDISVQWMKNHKADTSLEYSTTSPMKEGKGDSTFFLYSNLNVNRSSWNSGTFYTCMVVHEALPQKFTQRTISKASGK